MFQDGTGALFRLGGLRFPTGLSTGLDHFAPLSLQASGPKDRWSIASAWIAAASGASLQRHLLRNGLALADPQGLPPACARALLAAEDQARRHRSGLWAQDFPLKSSQPEEILRHYGRFVVIEGRIISLGKSSKTRYLNFGTSWNQDLTVTISRREEHRFESLLNRMGFLLARGKHIRVRVRGLVEEWGGPAISLRGGFDIQLRPEAKGRKSQN